MATEVLLEPVSVLGHRTVASLELFAQTGTCSQAYGPWAAANIEGYRAQGFCLVMFMLELSDLRIFFPTKNDSLML